jgi:cell division FtsZ-interacting protein ZapD
VDYYIRKSLKVKGFSEKSKIIFALLRNCCYLRKKQAAANFYREGNDS